MSTTLQINDDTLTDPHIDADQQVWDVLDEASQWEGFSKSVSQDPENPLIESQFLLEGLHCAACAGIIEQGLLASSGISRARVSMSKNRGAIVWSPNITKPSNILKTIHKLGYSAQPATLLAHQNEVSDKKRAAFWRWLVAGFCAMQVMMYAAPSYFTETGDISSDIENLLNWASWLLSLPVLLFSSSGFFKNAFQDLKHQRISMDLPVAIGISITFIVSSAATFNPTGWWGNTVYFDSMTMLVFFLLSARLIEARLHSKTMGALETLMNRIPENTTKVQADGTLKRILNSQLKVNDIVQINIGEAFPADGKITQGSTQVDESLLTGESTPIHKNNQDSVIAGSYNVGQTVQMCVNNIGESTQYGQIIQLINQAAIEKPRLAGLIDRIAKPFLLFVILSAALAAALLWQQSHAQALMTAATVLIVTCPCALSLATPAAMLATASAFVKKGILIKHLQAIENMANTDTIVFDKTGTLTNDAIDITHIDTKLGITEAQALNIAATLASHSKHPISRAIVRKNALNLVSNLSAIQETPGAGIQGTFNQPADYSTQSSSTPDTLSGTIKLGSAKFCEIKVTDTLKQQVYLADMNGWLATFDLEEQIKPLAYETIHILKEKGYTLELLSGDQPQTVSKVASDLSLHQFHAACSPNDKLDRLTALKAEGKKVLMVGDGLNDGPVLASAHVSIAMGKGVPLTHAHADYILLNGDISQIPAMIKHAINTMSVIKQNIVWAICYNLVCIPLAFFGYLSPWSAGLGMAVSSLLVVMNAMRLIHFSNDTLDTL